MQIIRVYCLSIINAVGHGGLGIVYNNGRNSAGSTLYIAVTSIFFSSLVNVFSYQTFGFPNHFD